MVAVRLAPEAGEAFALLVSFELAHDLLGAVDAMLNVPVVPVGVALLLAVLLVSALLLSVPLVSVLLLTLVLAAVALLVLRSRCRPSRSPRTAWMSRCSSSYLTSSAHPSPRCR